jgi:hypothetical protein
MRTIFNTDSDTDQLVYTYSRIRHNDVLYLSKYVINQDICYYFGVEFV